MVAVTKTLANSFRGTGGHSLSPLRERGRATSDSCDPGEQVLMLQAFTGL
jgi:hypothetical protein